MVRRQAWRIRRESAGVVACFGLATAFAAAQPYAFGPAGGPPSAPQVRPISAASSGLNDMLQVPPASATEMSQVAAEERQPERAPLPSPTSLAERLRALDDAARSDAQLQVELPSGASSATAARAGEIEMLWDAGHFDWAIAELQALEASGTPVALGVGWRTPQTSAARWNADVRIGTRTGGVQTGLDYDAATGKLFVVVRWDSDNGWALYQSTADGASWSEVYFWYAGVNQHATDVDLTVVDDYAYVGYVASDVADEARLRRIVASTGLVDNTYGYRVVLDAGANTITDVAVASNADSFNNRIYYAARQSNNAVRFAWDTSTDATSFTETSPTGTAAAGGLDLCWNPGYATYFAFLSYVGTDSLVHVLRKREAAWDAGTTAPFDGSHVRSAISAWDDHVICAHELQMDDGQGIRYFISHDGGDTWDFFNYVAEPDPGEGPYQMADVTARGGAGTAIVFTHEAGEPDDVLIRYRRGYAPGLWRAALRVNGNDVATGSWTTLGWTPRHSASSSELSYGLIYLYGTTPYFDRFQRRPGDTNCDGAVTFADIDPFVTALGGQAFYSAVYPDCDWHNADCNDDGAVNFRDIDPFVALLGTE